MSKEWSFMNDEDATSGEKRFCARCEDYRVVNTLRSTCQKCGAYCPRSNQASSKSSSDGNGNKMRPSRSKKHTSLEDYLAHNDEHVAHKSKGKTSRKGKAKGTWAPKSPQNKYESRSFVTTAPSGNNVLSMAPLGSISDYSNQRSTYASSSHQAYGPRHIPLQPEVYAQNVGPFQPLGHSQFSTPLYTRPSDQLIAGFQNNHSLDLHHYGSGPCACDPICETGEGCFGPVQFGHY